ncbi:MAG: nucleoside triphosphate pyrophosphohydrolase [Candidatus Zixiibacteriota bacterium]
MAKKLKPEEFEKLVKLMAKLRSEKGCPWDRIQTHKSLMPYLLEESYEVLDTIEAKDDKKLREELGDLLLQIVFHSQIAKEREKFDINGVIRDLIKKLVERHPHVFKKEEKISSEQVIKKWEHIKITNENRKMLSGIPRTLPALLKAYRVQEKVGRVGFDWKEKDDILLKLEEELEEFKSIYKRKKSRLKEEEIGDIFFTLVNLSRHMNINPEFALRRTINKFIKRFNYVEKELKKKGKSLSKATLEEMDDLWEKAKGKRRRS